MPTITDLADRYWDLYLRARPTLASLLGEHGYDPLIEDFTDQFRSEHVRSLRGLLAEVSAAEGDDETTRALLASYLAVDITEHETEVLVGPVDAYLGPHSETIRFAAQTSALEPRHALDLAQRYRQIPSMLDQALNRHRSLTDGGLPPAAATVRRVLSQLDAYLESPLESDPFVNLRLPDGWEGAGSWRAEMKGTVRDLVRPAFARYREALSAQILPRSRSDDQPGICHVADGEAIYRRLVERFVTVPYDPEEIHRIGHSHATETLPGEYEVIGIDAFDDGELVSILSRLRNDPSLRYQSESEMLAHAEEVVSRAWAAIDGWLGARPDGPCRVLPVPTSLAPDMPPAYYLQPAPDGSRPGTYFLNTHQPHTRDRFSAEAVAFHEGIPGHHFDRALASALTDLPRFRRLRGHNVHAEGWGLYSERLADEMGLYSGPVDRLGMLSADSWRAGRLVVDTGLHQLGWSRQEAIDFLERWTAVNPVTVAQEVDRYIGWPGQALSYKIGHIEIASLRRQAERELGHRFDIVGFHDTVLTSGSVTIPILRRLVDEWVASRS